MFNEWVEDLVRSLTGNRDYVAKKYQHIDPKLPAHQILEQTLRVMLSERWISPQESKFLQDRIFRLNTTPELLDVIQDWLAGDLKESSTTMSMWEQSLLYNLIQPNNSKALIWRLINLLWDHQRLTYFFFYRLVSYQQHNLTRVLAFEKSDSIYPDAFRTMKEDYLPRLREEVIQDYTFIGHRVLSAIKPPFEGSEYLLAALRQMSVHPVRKLSAHQSMFNCRADRPATGIAYLIINTQLTDIQTVEDRDRLVNQLRQFPREHLEKTLGIGSQIRDMVCEALGWQEAVPFVQMWDDITDLDSILDTPTGAETLSDLLKSMQLADEKIIRTILKQIEAAHLPNSSEAFILLAVLGDNRAQIMKKLGQANNEAALKAYALLPLEDDLVERYQFFTKHMTEAKRMQGKTRIKRMGAIKTALHCLALKAGYENAARLEWDMEGQAANLIVPQHWQADEYQIELTQNGIQPELRYHRKGKTLKNTPAALRKTPEYSEAKTALDRIRTHAQRLRNEVLDSFISSGDMFTPDDLHSWLELPLARAMLENLLFYLPEDNFIGLFCADELTLTDLKGKKHPIDRRFMLAHPLHLFESEDLGAWQRFITKQRITQPIKQVYRELYVLTPAEEDTHIYSNRFAGHFLNGRAASKWVALRGWGLRGRESIEIFKRFPQYGVQGVMSFPDARYSLWDNTVSDQVYFLPDPYLEGKFGRDNEADRIPLMEISPILFSEVMRDIDIFVTEAATDGGKRLSPEFYQKRRELIADLVEDLGLQGVAVDGEHAFIEGKLANYRLHLGTAVIHIEPGSYLCIVPSRKSDGKKKDSLYLPFADEDDPKTSEVVSKLLMLQADDQITDSSILAQIRMRRQRVS